MGISYSVDAVCVCLHCVSISCGIGVGSWESDTFSSGYGFVCGDGVTRVAVYVLEGVSRFEMC